MRSRRKSKDSLRQMKMKTQNFQMYGSQRKAGLRGKSIAIPAYPRNKKNLKQTIYIYT